MITLRRSAERRHMQHRKQEAWLTFSPHDQADPLAAGFGALESLGENRLPPSANVSFNARRDSEVITYVLEGALVREDVAGPPSIIYGGEFYNRTFGADTLQREKNSSTKEWAHFFQIGLRSPEIGLTSHYEQKRFTAAERRGVLCLIASSDQRKGSLRVYQDSLIFSSMLTPGQHLVYELSPTRRAWLHVIRGAASLGDIVLKTGDGAGFTAERSISITAQETTELLLLDLGEQPSTPTSGALS